MSMTKGTPASSQIVWLEGRVQELEAENERLGAEIDRLKDANAQLQEIVNSDTAEEERIRAENERLRAALRAAYEVYAGSDGFIPETAAEGYQQQIIRQMVDCIRAALEEKP